MSFKLDLPERDVKLLFESFRYESVILRETLVDRDFRSKSELPELGIRLLPVLFDDRSSSGGSRVLDECLE